MSPKNVVLDRIRAALGSDPPMPDVSRNYRRADTPATARLSLTDRLVDRLENYKAKVLHVGRDNIADAVAQGLGDAARVVVPLGLPSDWLPAGREIVTDEDLSTNELDRFDAVVTGATVAVAETGTIVLDGSPDQGRRAISLVPDLHVCVVDSDQVVGTVPAALQRLDATRPQTWLSGPSATSDIELNRIEGVHGPRTLQVILVEAT